MVKYLENENFKEVIGEGVWGVDFYADWCGPCKMLAPILEELDANVLKVNVDNHEELATEFGVMSIPTVCFFRDGELKEKSIGFKSKNDLETILKGI